MAKVNQTVSEVQLKRRRTSLGNKSNEELIDIILRKDKTERSQSAKINSLMELLKEADELNEDKATRILGFEKDMTGMEDKVNSKQEVIDSLKSENISLTEERDNYCKEVIRLKRLCNFRRNIIFGCFGIIVILSMLLIVLG